MGQLGAGATDSMGRPFRVWTKIALICLRLPGADPWWDGGVLPFPGAFRSLPPFLSLPLTRLSWQDTLEELMFTWQEGTGGL